MCSLLKCFENAVSKYSLEPALWWRTETESCVLTYKDLAQHSLNIKTVLQKYDNVSDYVGICIKQSFALVTVILGVLHGGLAFVCLDYSDSIYASYLIKKLNIGWVFCEKALEKSLNDVGCPWVLHKTLTVSGTELTVWKKESNSPAVKNNAYPRSNEMAYAVQTSGTTGLPKVVKVPHSCIVPNIEHLRSILRVGPGDLVFLTSPSTFDPSVVEIFLALSSGAALLIVPKHIKSSPCILLGTLFRDKGVTILESTPSFILRWSLEEIRNILFAETSTLRALLLGGEPCPPLSQMLCWKAKKNKTDLYNIYGITEVSCWATVHHILFTADEFIENEEVPLGEPLQGTILQVRNEKGVEITNGKGELFIGGTERSCLVDDETFESLSYPVFRETGDIVKVDGASKRLYFIRRKNNTLKRFGSRVSFIKVEQTAIRHDAVEQACCIWEESTDKLCLIIRSTKNVDINQGFLRRFKCYLRKHLEPPSVPDEIVPLQEFPLTNNGKTDYQKLKGLILKKILQWRKTLESKQEPCSVFSELWSSYLNLAECPKPNSTFINSGGNSVIALQLATEFEHITHSAAPKLIGLLLQGATFEECCKVIISGIPSTYSVSANVDMKRVGDTQVSSKEQDASVAVSEYPVKRPKLEKNDKIHTETEANSSFSEQYVKKQQSAIRFSCCRGLTYHFDTHRKAVIRGSWHIKVKWKFKLGKCVDASPQYTELKGTGGIVIIGSHSHKLAVLKSETGDLMAMSDLNDRIESSACVSHCGEYAFLGSYDGNIYCIKVNTGEIKWQHQTADMVKSSPALCSSIQAIVVGSYDHSLYCIHIQDGKLLWSLKVGNGGIYSSPCISASSATVFVGDLKGLCIAVREKTGDVLWKHQLESPIFSSPALIHNETAVLYAEVFGLVHCFRAESGEKIWMFKVDGNIFSSFCTQGVWHNHHRLEMIIFGCHNRHLYCLESDLTKSKATLKWKCSLDAQIFATPILFSCSVLPENQYSTLVAAASTKGTVYIVDAASGTVKCTHSLPGEVFSSPAVSENQIFIGCRDDYVYALELN